MAKWRYVSAECRLTVHEEGQLLSMVDTDGVPSLYNRRMFVRSLLASLDGSPTPPISLRYPPTPALRSFDALGASIELGTSALDTDKWWLRFSSLSYSRPDETSGAATIAQLDRWLEHGLLLSGGKDALGFLFLYELMTSSPATHPPFGLAVHSRRAAHSYAAAPRPHSARPAMSTLRVLCYNPHPLGLPRYGQPPLQVYQDAQDLRRAQVALRLGQGGPRRTPVERPFAPQRLPPRPPR